MNYITVDVGGTFIKHALMDETGSILKQGKVATPLTIQQDFLDRIQMIVNDYHTDVEGLAMSLPGTIDGDSGFVYQGGTLKFNSMCHLKKQLENQLQMPVEIENDAHCAALAELW